MEDTLGRRKPMFVKDLDVATLRLALRYLIECDNAPAPGFFGAFTLKLHIGYVSLALGWTNMAVNNFHSAKEFMNSSE